MWAKRIGKRFLQMGIILIGVSFFTFLLTYLAPGDAVTAMYSSGGALPDEAVLEAARAELGLDEPFWMQYFHWLLGCLHGDFGTSYVLQKPVLQLLSSRLLPTLELAFTALVLMLAVSVPLGMLSAVYRGKPIDYAVRALTFLGISMPNFWLGMILLYVFAIQWKIFPVVSSGGGLKQVLLPAVTLAFAMMGKYTRQVRTAVLEELNQDYVVGARALGLPERVILWKNVFPNALFSLVTLLGLSLGSLLGGTAVVEVIFSYPGLGNLAVTSISARDYPMIQGYVLWIAFIYMLINLIVDISYDFLDPKIRESRREHAG